MNTLNLQDILHGRYGRKIAYVDYTEITDENILKILSKTIGIFYWNRTAVDYLWRYKNGDAPIRYRNKSIRDDVQNNIVENHAWEIVQFKNGQTFGEPLQYVSRRNDETISEAVDKLNDYVNSANKQVKDISSGEWTSAVGTGFKAIQKIPNGEVPFRITVPTPKNTYIVYSSITEEPLLAVQILKDEDGNQYYLCYDNKYEYTIQNGMIVPYWVDGVAYTKRLHLFGDIPIVEFPNNQDRISDIELVIDLLDAINNMQSNRMDAVEQFVQSFIKFVNCDIDAEKFEEMKKLGAILVKSTKDKQADVDIMTQELNQTETQVAKSDLWDSVLSILAIPRQSNGSDGGSTTGAVELRGGWDFAKTRAMLKDQYIIEGEKRLAKIILNVIHTFKGDEECKVGMLDIDVKISHSPTDNLVAKCNALALMLSQGISPKEAIKTCGIWSDDEKVYLQSKETLNIKQNYDGMQDKASDDFVDSSMQDNKMKQ